MVVSDAKTADEFRQEVVDELRKRCLIYQTRMNNEHIRAKDRSDAASRYSELMMFREFVLSINFVPKGVDVRWGDITA